MLLASEIQNLSARSWFNNPSRILIKVASNSFLGVNFLVFTSVSLFSHFDWRFTT